MVGFNFLPMTGKKSLAEKWDGRKIVICMLPMALVVPHVNDGKQ